MIVGTKHSVRLLSHHENSSSHNPYADDVLFFLVVAAKQKSNAGPEAEGTPIEYSEGYLGANLLPVH